MSWCNVVSIFELDGSVHVGCVNRDHRHMPCRDGLMDRLDAKPRTCSKGDKCRPSCRDRRLQKSKRPRARRLAA